MHCGRWTLRATLWVPRETRSTRSTRLRVRTSLSAQPARSTTGYVATCPKSLLCCVQVQYQNLTATQIDFTCTINSGTFMVTTYIFEEAGSIMNGGEESIVSNGTLKFSINVNNWDWCTGANCRKGQTEQTGAFLDVDLTVQGLAAATAKPKANANLSAANQTVGIVCQVCVYLYV